jgi:hypothetical protein
MGPAGPELIAMPGLTIGLTHLKKGFISVMQDFLPTVFYSIGISVTEIQQQCPIPRICFQILL